jgi:hypothetical protein
MKGAKKGLLFSFFWSDWAGMIDLSAKRAWR